MSDLKSVLTFDGKNDYVEIPYQTELNPAQFTLSCWARVMGSQRKWRSPVSSRAIEPGKGGYMLYAGTNNKWMFWIGDGDSWVRLRGSNIVLKTWTHVAATYDGSTMRLYLNGEQVGTPVQSKIKLNTSYPLRIGAGANERNADFFFNGQVAEVQIWNLVRSPAELKQSMKRRLKGNEPGLVGYWSLEGDNATIKDLSPNNNDGNITGAVWSQMEIPLEAEVSDRPKPTPAKTENVNQPQSNQGEEKYISATGLEDYARWKTSYKDHQRDKQEKPFRRGRIWS